MNTSSSNKVWIIALIVIAIASLVYFYGIGGDQSGSGLLESQARPEADIISGRILSLLNQIQELKIDNKLFSSAAYQSLQDYSVIIPEQNVGRPNPFAPF